MRKRDLILDSMLEILSERKGKTCTVGEIAKRAGIAKGGMYYYFKSKEEVFDALVERTYRAIIRSCEEILGDNNLDAMQKLERLYRRYRGSVVSADLDEYLHLPQNAEIHQKSLAKILTELSPLVTRIIEQGVSEHRFRCEYPREMSEILLSVFCFLLDPGIFPWTPEEIKKKLILLSNLAEKGLGADKGSMSFFSEFYFPPDRTP